MTGFILGLGAGLLLGWNLIPQPTWVKNQYYRWFTGR